MRFKFRIAGDNSFQFTRLQFPLRLAYAMTYNKSQGQTIERVLMVIITPPFTHGHVYVPLSKVTNYANIRMYCRDVDTVGFSPILTYIVYPEFLL